MPKKHSSAEFASANRNLEKLPPKTAFRLDEHAFYLFGKISSQREGALNAVLRPFDLDDSKWRALAVLHEHPGCSMQKLASETSVDRTTLNYTIRNMAAQKLVRREERASDRRSVALNLTKHGARVFDQILPIVMHHNARCFLGFSGQELDLFVEQLRRVITNLRNNSSFGG